MGKKISLKQIAANQANAQKSTGPKTPEGRAVSKMNALKHGIYSKEVLVRGLNLKENSREFDALYERFWQDLNPVGPVEEMLVGQIVTAHWRLRRTLRAESGEIALSVDGGQWQRSRHHPHWPWTGLTFPGHRVSDPVLEMQESAEGNSMMANWLCEVRVQVEEEGALTEAAIKIPFFGKPNSLSRELEGLRLRLSQNSDAADPASQREENKKQALRAIDRKLERLEGCKADCENRENAEEEARQAAAVLPAPEVLDKILRYETTIQRQLYRALAQLERLQRMRQGEAVPVPMVMELSERA
jgi:hypothetical protein